MNHCVWTISAILVFSLASCCDLPRAQWCQDEETAKKCGKLKECFAGKEADSSDRSSELTLSFVYETHCPDCKRFITKQLWNVFQELSELNIRLEMLPYGKAIEKYDKASGKWKFFCQHGKRECTGNLIQTCAIQITKSDPYKYLPFIRCMALASKPLDVVPTCAKENAIDLKLINDCVLGNAGNVFQHKVALKTKIIANPLTYVPWIAINGKRNKKAEFNLKAEICAALPEPKPTQC